MYDREDYLQEKAPPSAKHERMVKHIKARYKEGGLTDKEKAIAYATAWKHYNKEEVEQIDEGLPILAGAAALAAGAYGIHKAGEAMKKSREGGVKARPGSIESNIQKRRAQEAELMKQSYEPEGGNIHEIPLVPIAIGAGLAAGAYGLKKASDSMKNSGAKARPGSIESNIQKRRAQEAELMKQSYEPSGEMVDERTRYAKETGKSFTTGRSSEEGGDPRVAARNKPPFKYGGSRQEPKERGKKPPRAGEPGSGVQDPAHKVALRRSRRELAKKNPIGSRFDHYEMEGSDLQEKYLYTYLYERNYDALDKDMDGDKDFADVMVARMIASGKSKEEAIKSTMNKEYNKKGKKVKISDGFSNWRDELGEELSKKSPFVDVMPKNGTDSDESGSLKAARKRQQPNQKVTEETLEEFADSLGGFLVEAEQLDELAPLAIGAGSLALRAAPYAVRALPALGRAVSAAVKSPAARNVLVKSPRGFKPTPVPVKPTPVPVKPTPVPVKPTPAPAPSPKPAPAPSPKPAPAPSPKPKVQRPVKTAVGTAVAAAAATKTATDVLLQPLVKSQPATKRDVLVGSPPGTPGGGGGGTPRGGRIPLPGLPKMDWRGHIGYTQNPQ